MCGIIRKLLKSTSLVFLFLVSILVEASSGLKVVSFNILSPNYLACGGYEKLPEEVIGWKQRKKRILDKLIESKADIICLQEIDSLGFDFFNKYLSQQGYQAVFGLNPTSNKDSVATFYLGNNFEYKEHTIHSYPYSHKSFLILQLEKNSPITIVNTKFKWDREDKDLSQHKGYQQSKYLVNYLKNKYKLENTILCGDFNASPNSHIITNLKKNFKDVFNDTSAKSFYNNGEAKRIDYIMVSNDLDFEPIISQQEQSLLTSIPSLDYPSDHLMVSANVYNS